MQGSLWAYIVFVCVLPGVWEGEKLNEPTETLRVFSTIPYESQRTGFFWFTLTILFFEKELIVGRRHLLRVPHRVDGNVRNKISESYT